MFNKINYWSSWKCKIIKNNNKIIYLKRITIKLDKYIKDKNEKNIKN